jgi:CRP/FNR family transcriptional regulator, nitrogen fixation regulation protein
MLMPVSLQKPSSNETRSGRRSEAPPDASPLARVIEVIGVPMTYAGNHEIYGQGEPADYLYKVVRGAVRASKVLADGRRQIGSFYLPGDIFGLEIGNDHAFSAEAITDSKVLVVRRSALVGLAGLDSTIAQQMWKLAGRELARIQGHILLLVKNAQERVVSFLLEMADRTPEGRPIELPMSRQDIADYLGLTIETVSRTLTALDRDGAIHFLTAHSVMVRQRSALARLSA